MRNRKYVWHHIKNRCHGGPTVPQNLLRLKDYRETAFHQLFKNMDLRRAAECLLRMARRKEKQGEETSDDRGAPVLSGGAHKGGRR